MSDAKPETSSTEALETQAPSPTPVFGSSSTFGTGTGFGGFTGVKAGEATTGDQEGDDGEEAGEEDCSAEFKPIVQLDEVEVSTGEEDETALFDAKSKLYRFDADANEWKERGIGQARVLQHKANQRIRFLFRQEKTLKVRSNHIIMPGTKVQEHTGSEKSMVWSCVDFASEEQRMELFCIRFASAERAQEFKAAYDKAAEDMGALLGDAPQAEEGAEEAEPSEADKLAAEVEKGVSVKDGEPTVEPPEEPAQG
ncbi:Ran-binding protein 1-like protein a [Auxenochlorella protothecoides]|uniref:Ran-binding protein 1-like protein a n=2 Tax=Auxenochlorella protothecoides TaxID=3075 RepID=A0A087SBC0_AUXPR|nr:Ran-binding protein 1-like protein a [Auxenochlorella protothecoides]KFM23024.1 Ran-binding protein 1-like protein a [Auxenochlorella protothecoides]RMZ54201.1 hypothetical protein APUTEX25_005357 [Auxenochlorella protothecoides]|eukprot:RMZ54201.1 hypothetical protein APUTEX25_005357 [Auxenochlorella protothecoides]